MHRFYLPPAECQKEPLALSERESHHAVNVLRIRPHERVVVLSGAGDEFLCEVRETGRRNVTLMVLQKNRIPPLPCQVTLAQAVTRGKTMEMIVQKATELGAHRIVPILSGRTVAQVKSEAARTRLEKWAATAVEAIKQCGSAWLPHIEWPLSPQEFLLRAETFDLPLIATLQSDARHPRERFDSFRSERKRSPGSICVWVGPEGDFTPAEINSVRAAGALPITLGPLVLRSETAAIYCLSVINYELQSHRDQTDRPKAVTCEWNHG
jgi:16S rRNA (uracil1498-N3)-methyltransferase